MMNPGLVLAVLLASGAAASESQLRKGNRLYGKEKYVESLEQFSRAAKEKPSDPRPVFNGGNALYRLSELDGAGRAFESLTDENLPPALRAGSYYNAGNTRYQAGDYKAAARAYRSSLVIDPSDQDARHNLAMALRSQKNPPKQCPNPKKNEDKKDQDKKDGKKDDQSKQDQGKPPETQTRPQDQMQKEDAERIMSAAAEKEKAAQQQMQRQQVGQKERPEVREDW